MSSSNFLQQALIYLAAAVICVPVAKRFGMSSVLGYILSGILIGPFVLGLIGVGGQDIMHAAEFGVVMMLFVIGLELEPKKFWEMRKAILGLGLSQLAGTIVLLFIAFILTGWKWQIALAVSMAFAMSSTAIVLQSLKEKGLSQTVAGESSFAVLLFQDIAVIPVLALLPLLAYNDVQAVSSHDSLLSSLPAWMQALAVLGAGAAVYIAGRFLVVPLFRAIARTGLRELFTAASLLLVIAVAYLMQVVGLSPALGTFIAGVVLANSEFRHELESDIEPFKGLLLGLFFIGVGATIDFNLLKAEPGSIAAIVLIVIAIKFAILFLIGKWYKISNDQNFLFAFGLSQVGEFAFVLLSFSNQLTIIDASWNAKLMAVTAITMMITPILLLVNEKIIDPYFGVKEVKEEKEADEITKHHKVILAGFGHFGSTIGRLLRANGVEATILDNDSDRVELLRKMGFKVYYGDATRIELLKSAGADEAKLFIAAIDSPETNRLIITELGKHFPNLKVLARARNRMDAYELIDLGVKNIYRETLYTAVHLGVEALSQLGHRKYSAMRLGQKFIQYDEAALKKLAAARHNQKEYILSIREEIALQEQLMHNDIHSNLSAQSDHSWDSEFLRDTILKNSK
jgi:monovalent cation:H+ antiporter-2, CPA2 family